MDKISIIGKTREFVKSKLQGEGSGHDWWHVYRVRENAVHIAEKEGADLFVVELSALLHDIADWKFNDGDESLGAKTASKWLSSLEVDSGIIEHVAEIIMTISFKGAKVESKMKTKEGMIVQDADRLDAIGAIGIGRAFAYGGFKGREMYNPDIKPVLHNSFEQYKNGISHTMNHFHEKLLLLRDLMNTDTARQIADSRHKFMEAFIERFYKEWEGKE